MKVVMRLIDNNTRVFAYIGRRSYRHVEIIVRENLLGAGRKIREGPKDHKNKPQSAAEGVAIVSR